MPPALPRATPSEILPFLGARAQIGYPASIRPDASSENSAMGYQSGGVAQNICGAGNFNLIRLVGPASKGHEAKNRLAQKTKVGFCLCCVEATHIPVPSFFKFGTYSELRGLGMRIWADEGRRLAAVQ